MPENPKVELREAADRLDAVRGGVRDAETAGRLETFAERLRKWVDADRGPDHGQLDRLMHGLREVESALDGDDAEAVASALSRVRTYRETVEGV